MNAASSLSEFVPTLDPRDYPEPGTACLLPAQLVQLAQSLSLTLTPRILIAVVQHQRLLEFVQSDSPSIQNPIAHFQPPLVASTSRFGVGQEKNSNQTPLGLHRIARKIGDGMPEGTVFKARVPIGILGDGKTDGAICHRILWLEGLEEGWNRGGNRDTFERYIYIHGFHDESTLGRPASMGCIHLAAADLIPLFDRVHEGTLVWIVE